MTFPFGSKDWPILLFALFLACLKIPLLDLPIWWDELMYFNHNIFEDGFGSLIPPHYNPSFFYGHPPLFQIQLLTANLFIQDPIIASHICGLLNSLLFVLVLYTFVKTWFSRQAAFLSAALFFMYPHIFSQASQAMPNTLMLVLGLLSVHFYLKNDFNKYAIFATLAILTRESALAFCLYPLLDSALNLRRQKVTWKNFGLICLPIGILAIFFVYNKLVAGAFLNNPVVVWRLEQDQWNLEQILNKFYATWGAFLQATSSIYERVWVLPLAGLLYLAISKRAALYKRNAKIVNSLLVPALAFTGFYFSYADTVPRDFYYLTFVFSVAGGLLFTHFFRGPVLAGLWLAVIASFNIGHHFKDLGGDHTIESYVARSSHLKSVAKYIDSEFTDVQTVNINWPGGQVFNHPLYGYVSKPYRTYDLIDERKGEVMVVSDANVPSNASLKFGNWELKKTISQGALKTKIYKKKAPEASFVE